MAIPAEMRAALGVVVLALAGCAITRAPVILLLPQAQEAALRELDYFSLKGKTAVKAGDDGFIASLDWRQEADAASVSLSGNLGLGRLTVTWQPGSLRLETSRGQEFEGVEAEQVLLDELGFVPPFGALRYWMLGLEAPGDTATQRTVTESGRLGELTQQQWHIQYERWMNVAADAGGVQLPRTLTVTRDELRLKVTVRRWKL